MPEAEAAGAVVDASAMVEALLGTKLGIQVRARMRGRELHAPAHLDAEVLSAFGRLHRAGDLAAAAAQAALRELADAPIRRHALADLLSDAWCAREQFRLVDALYVELARSLGSIALLTTDARLANQCEVAELIDAPPP
ncbi:MAG: PIN domain-containing protein [Actinobacteria bacterium]|nr:MAG: PIN domain-containing protein [Actinomycetota bacterium]